MVCPFARLAGLRAFYFALARDFALASASALAINSAVPVQGAAPALAVELRSLFAEVPRKDDPIWWRRHGPAWLEKLRAVAILHRDIGHDWGFTPDQRTLLNAYYYANRLLVDCMNAAKTLTNQTRHQIEDTMLLPWDEIYPPQT